MTLYELFVKLSADKTDLDKGLRDAKNNLGKFAKDSEGFGSQIAKALPFAAIGAAAVSAAQKFQDAEFTIRRATGATGADLESLNKSFQNVYKSTARSAEEVSGVLSKLTVETKLTGKALEELTSYNLKFAKVTGQDAKQAIEGSQNALKQWNIEGRAQKAALDDLYKVMQATGISVGRLESGMAAAGPALRSLGYSFRETAILVGNFEEKGLAIEAVVGALQKGFVKLAETSNDPKKAFTDLVERMSKASTATDAVNMAADTFGKRGAVVLADAVRKGAFEVSKLTEEFNKNADTVGKAADETVRFADQFKKLGHTLEAEAARFAPILTAIGVAGPLFVGIGQKIISLAKIVIANPAFGLIGLAAVSALAAIKATADAIDNLKERYNNAFGRRGTTPVGKTLIEPWTKGEGAEFSAGLGIGIAKPTAPPPPETSPEWTKEAQDAYNRSKLAFDERSAQANLLARNVEEAWKWQQMLNGEFEAFGADVPELTGKVDDLRKVWEPTFAKAPTQIDEISGAFKTLGITSADEYQRIADASKAAYDTIERSGIATMEEVTRAFLKSERDQIRAAEAKGIAVSDSWKKMLDQIEADINKSTSTSVKATKTVESGLHKLGQQVSTVLTDLSRDIADLIFDGGKLKDVLVGVAESFGKALLRMAIEAQLESILGLFKNLIKEGSTLGKVLSDIFVGWGKSSASNTATKSAGGAASTVSGGASSAAGSAVGGIANIVTGAISAGANVVSAIWNVRQEGTLNAIEHEVRYTQIHTLNILELLNTYVPALQRLYDYTTTVIHELLKQVRDACASFVKVTLNVSSGSSEANDLLNALIERAQTSEYNTGEAVADQTNVLLNIYRELKDRFRETIKAISTYGEIIAGQLHGLQKSTLEKVLGFSSAGLLVGGNATSGLGALGMAALGPVGILASGLASLFGGGGGDDAKIEWNTRKSSLHLEALLEKANAHWPGIDGLNSYNWNVQAKYLQMICAGVESIDSKSVSSGGTYTINISGAGDPKSVAQEVIKALKLQSTVAAYA